jgi:hypothetical protein
VRRIALRGDVRVAPKLQVIGHALHLTLPVARGGTAHRIGLTLAHDGLYVGVGAVECRRVCRIRAAHEVAHTVHRDGGGPQVELPERHATLPGCVVAPHPFDEVEHLPLQLRVRRMPARSDFGDEGLSVDGERG